MPLQTVPFERLPEWAQRDVAGACRKTSIVRDKDGDHLSIETGTARFNGTLVVREMRSC